MPKMCFFGVQHLSSTMAAAIKRPQQRTCVGECAAGRKTQTFPVGADGDLRGVDALGDLLVGGFLGDH